MGYKLKDYEGVLCKHLDWVYTRLVYSNDLRSCYEREVIYCKHKIREYSIKRLKRERVKDKKMGDIYLREIKTLEGEISIVNEKLIRVERLMSLYRGFQEKYFKKLRQI